MDIVKRDLARGWMMPWMRLPSIFDEDFTNLSSESNGINMWEDDKKVYVDLAVPGMKEKDIDVQLENGVLTVRAAKEEKEEEKKGKKKVYSSSMSSSFYYSTTLPSSIDSSKVEANLVDGVLNLEIVKSEQSKPKKIEVKRK